MHEVLIIGAGPAGLSAAIACRQWDLNVTVIDEFPKPGGRLLGQLYQEKKGTWWNGIQETEKLLEKLEQLHAELRCGVSAVHIEKTEAGFQVFTNEGVLEAENVLIASGAAEAPAPIPGWTLPGVMSIGAAQVMTNVHRVRVGDRGIIIGINALSAAIAQELLLAGIELHSMVLPALHPALKKHGDPNIVMEDLARMAHLAPSKWIQLGSSFMKSPAVRKLAVKYYPKSGVKIWGMPIHVRKAATAIHGTEQVEAVTICDISANGEPIPGSEKTVEVDFACISGGLYPLAELAAAAGCPFQYIEELGGHVPLHNEYMETPLEGLYVAGNITGIESAKVALAQGTLAGLSIVRRKLSHHEKLEQQIQDAANHVKQVREHADIQFLPQIVQGRLKMEEAYRKHIAGQKEVAG